MAFAALAVHNEQRLELVVGKAHLKTILSNLRVKQLFQSPQLEKVERSGVFHPRRAAQGQEFIDHFEANRLAPKHLFLPEDHLIGNLVGIQEIIH